MEKMIDLSLLGNVFIITGLWFQAKKVWWAFLFSLIGEGAYIVYALARKEYNFALICTVFFVMAARALYYWRKDAR